MFRRLDERVCALLGAAAIARAAKPVTREGNARRRRRGHERARVSSRAALSVVPSGVAKAWHTSRDGAHMYTRGNGGLETGIAGGCSRARLRATVGRLLGTNSRRFGFALAAVANPENVPSSRPAGRYTIDTSDERGFFQRTFCLPDPRWSVSDRADLVSHCAAPCESGGAVGDSAFTGRSCAMEPITASRAKPRRGAAYGSGLVLVPGGSTPQRTAGVQSVAGGLLLVIAHIWRMLAPQLFSASSEHNFQRIPAAPSPLAAATPAGTRCSL